MDVEGHLVGGAGTGRVLYLVSPEPGAFEIYFPDIARRSLINSGDQRSVGQVGQPPPVVCLTCGPVLTRAIKS